MGKHRSGRKRVRRVLLVLVMFSLLVFVAEKRDWLGSGGRVIAANQPGMYSINHFVDGDTIAVNMNGVVENVRFIGIDTPETHKPNTPVQCFGPQAAAHTKQMIGRGPVRLVADPLSTDRDRYNRLLRYVYLPDGTNLNELNIQQGYAFYYPYFPFSKSAEFAADEQMAITAKKGLWSVCKPTPSDDGGYKMNELAIQQTSPG